MSRTNKELAIDVAIAVIAAHTKQIVVTSNNLVRETSFIDLKSITNIIKGVYNTLEDLESDKSSDQ